MLIQVDLMTISQSAGKEACAAYWLNIFVVRSSPGCMTSFRSCSISVHAPYSSHFSRPLAHEGKCKRFLLHAAMRNDTKYVPGLAAVPVHYRAFKFFQLRMADFQTQAILRGDAESCDCLGRRSQNL